MGKKYQYHGIRQPGINGPEEFTGAWGAGIGWLAAQSFTPEVDHIVTEVVLYLQHRYDPVTLRLSIYEGALPENGAELAFATVFEGDSDPNWGKSYKGSWDFEFVKFTLDTPLALTTDTKYTIVLAGTYSGERRLNWRWKPDATYTRGSTWHYVASWIEYDQEPTIFDYWFEEWGESPVGAPEVTTDPATSVQLTTAIINGTLDEDGGEPCDCGFEWGETIAYEQGATTPVSKETGETFAHSLSGLKANTTYHFRAIAENSAGVGYGEDRVFTTPFETQPAASLDVRVDAISGTGCTVIVDNLVLVKDTE